jgi:hypothetical protein
MFPECPPGWLTLQHRAQRAKTAKELTRIIDEMNQLLSKYEAAVRGEPQSPDMGGINLEQQPRRV